MKKRGINFNHAGAVLPSNRRTVSGKNFNKIMSFSTNSQPVLSEKELKAQFASKELFSFKGYLARKGSPKSYTEKKKPTYRLNILGFFAGSALRILAGFMAVSSFLAGLFFGSELAGIVGAVVALVSLEILQIRNATELFETWFQEQRVVKSAVIYGLLFSTCTATLAFMGVDDTIRFVSETVAPFNFDESKVNPTLLADVEKAEADVQEFFKARSWKGKLDAKDGKRYNELKDAAKDLRKQYRDEVSTARIDAKNTHDLAVAGSKQDQADNKFYLTLLILVTEVLFWFAFYHKERYEFFAFKEYELTTAQEAPHPSGNQGQDKNKTNGHPNGQPTGTPYKAVQYENFQ